MPKPAKLISYFVLEDYYYLNENENRQADLAFFIVETDYKPAKFPKLAGLDLKEKVKN